MGPLRLVLRSLARHRARSSLTIGGVALAVALMISLLGFNAGYEKALGRNIERIGYHVLVTAKGCPYEAATVLLKGGTGLTYIRSAIADQLAADPRVKLVSRQLIRPFFDLDAGSSSYYLGVEDAFKITQLDFREGGWFSAPGAAEAILGYEAAELEQRHVGDEILVPDEALPEDQRVLKVVGVLQRVGNQTDGTVHVPLGWMQRTFKLEDKLTGIGVVLTDRALPAVAQYEADLNADPSLGEAQVIGLKAARSAIVGLLEDARALTAAVLIVALFVAAIGVMNTVLMSVLERTPQIGVMKALGAADGDVFRIVLLETLIVCAAGGVLGLGLAAAGTDLLALALRRVLPFAPTGELVSIEASTLGVAAAVVAAMGLLGGLLPAIKAARIEPIQAIRQGE